jgi:hypothetical protein
LNIKIEGNRKYKVEDNNTCHTILRFVNIFDIYVTEYGTALTTILPILFLYLNTVTVTAGTFSVTSIIIFDFVLSISLNFNIQL